MRSNGERRHSVSSRRSDRLQAVVGRFCLLCSLDGSRGEILSGKFCPPGKDVFWLTICAAGRCHWAVRGNAVRRIRVTIPSSLPADTGKNRYRSRIRHGAATGEVQPQEFPVLRGHPDRDDHSAVLGRRAKNGCRSVSEAQWRQSKTAMFSQRDCPN